MAENFTAVEWAATANIYEVNVRQYTAEGTFAAFEKELPRLRDMGVDILWFMPLTPISKEKRQGTFGSYYACSDYTSINPEFGRMEDFKNLVNAAHESGFKILIDWVANHTGWDHKWTVEHPKFYKKNADGEFYEANGWIDVIDLDYENQSLRVEMIKAMKFWVNECDIDGFRCDMAHLVPLDFWSEARTQIDEIRPLFWLAECEVPEYHKVFDATYAWKLLHTMEAVYKGIAHVNDLDIVLIDYEDNFPKDALRLCFTSNHDENSHSGSEYERLGNAAKVFAVLCATYKNSLPLIYSGQEMPNKKQLLFFYKDDIEWTGQFLLHDFYKTLLNLKKYHPAMKAGDASVTTTRIQTTSDENVFAFINVKGTSKVLFILNLSSTPKLKFKLVDFSSNHKYTSVFSGLEIYINGEIVFEMQEWEYLVYVNQQQ